tara:strand:+ start:84 stop:389 length:306 start_codon:yes stop_codon:yes gene_type:complete
LILSNFSIASLWNIVWLKSHELRVLHVWVTETTVLVTEGLSFSIWVPVIMGLVMSVILIEGIIQVTINPGELWDVTEVEWHLGVFSWLILVDLSEGIKLLV